MNLNKLHQKRKLKNNRGWVTIELLYSIPILIAVMVLIVYFGWAMYMQQALTYATTAAVRQLAKTGECGQADAVFTMNFDKPLTTPPSCSPSSDISTYSVQYTFNDIPVFLISVPPIQLKASASTVTEKTN